MTDEEFRGLKAGDLVRHGIWGETYVVTGHDGTRVTAVRRVDLTNPQEWERVLTDGGEGMVGL